MYSVSVLITELLHGSVSTVQKLSRDSSPPISQVLWFVYLLRSVRSVAVSINYSYQYQLSVSAASICFVVRHRYRYGISIIWCRSLEKRSLRIVVYLFVCEHPVVWALMAYYRAAIIILPFCQWTWFTIPCSEGRAQELLVKEAYNASVASNVW